MPDDGLECWALEPATRLFEGGFEELAPAGPGIGYTKVQKFQSRCY
jgi:hypothetical protein